MLGNLLLSDPQAANDFLLFRSRQGTSYLYDTNTNTVHPWPYHTTIEDLRKLYAADGDALSRIPCLRQQPELHHYVSVWRRSTGAFKVASTESAARLAFESGPPPHARGPALFSDLVLISTEACNHRCAYCVYSGHYPNQRPHRTTFLTADVARKAVDYFLRLNEEPFIRACPRRNRSIFFYGGEPLLHFDLIRDVVTYAKSRTGGYGSLSFGLSTNLTLLDQPKLEFLREHDVFLCVSLDGPADVHDSYRRFADGRPSCGQVMEKLALVRALDETYYSQRVRLLVTVTGNTPLLRLLDFFDSQRTTLPRILMVNFLRDFQSSLFHEAHQYDKHRFDGEFRTLVDEYLRRKTHGDNIREGDLLYYLVEDGLLKLYRRIHTLGSGQPSWYTGTCYPGRKLALAPDGRYYTCERVDYGHPVGDVETGLREDLISQLFGNYNKALPDCNTCWARQLCLVCFAAVCHGDEFSFDEQCCATRTECAARLALLYTLLERDPHALGEITNTIVPQHSFSIC